MRDPKVAKKYETIKEYLLENIQNGSYTPERPIPPERELAAMFGVNRMTVRRAIEELMYDGFLIRKKGSGTYLAREKVRKDELIHTSDEDHEDTIRLISCRYCREGNYGFKMLELPENGSEGYFRIRRVRYLSGVPYAYEDLYLRESFFPDVDSSYHTMGLHSIVQEKGSQPHPFRQQQVEALLCLKATGNLLNVKEDSPILQIKTWFYTGDSRELMMYCRSYHPGDSYVFRSRNIMIK